MSKRMNEIMKQISNPKIKCVSFDMFDTLVQRPALNPKDIYHLIGNIMGESPFFEKRRVAAQERAMLLKDYYTAYITLDDIYKHYQIMFGVSEEDAQKIKQTEMNVERKLLFPRRSVKKLFEYARLKGKKIIIVTDMYLPSDFLEEILMVNGYKNWYKIFVSCEENATKRSGELYEKVILELKKIGIYEHNILHIGDNLQSDVESAELKGIKSIHIPSAASCFMKCARLATIEKWKSKIYPSSQTLMLGLYACVVFDDPFIAFDVRSRYNGNATLLGEFVAPFLIAFCLWMINQANEDGIDLLALVWRDGFLPEKIINLLCPYLKVNIPKMQKVYLNRALRYSFVADNHGGLFDSMYQWSLNPHTSIEEFTQSFMGCHTDEEKQVVYEIFADKGYTSIYDEIGGIEKYNWFIHELEPVFLKMHEESRTILSNKIIRLKEAGQLGVFDIGYRGTVSRFLEETYNIKSTTYHMFGTMGIDEKVEGVTLKSFISYSEAVILNTKGAFHKFMELIISEQVSGILKYENEDQAVSDPFFEIDSNVVEIQNGIIRYATVFVELFGEYISYLNIDRNVLFTMITSLLSSPSEKDAKVIRDLSVTTTHYANKMTTFDTWFDAFFKCK